MSKVGDLPESSRCGNGSHAAAIESRTEPDTAGYTPGLIPCFSFIYATCCYAVGCTRTRLRGLTSLIIAASFGKVPTTFVLLLTSLFSRSSGLLDQIFCQC